MRIRDDKQLDTKGDQSVVCTVGSSDIRSVLRRHFYLADFLSPSHYQLGVITMTPVDLIAMSVSLSDKIPYYANPS